ncbi:MAG TPA: hypothetical protein VM686_31100 [Polyangiaceae bacterium]|nr:hypothetical protein [Polyangiaceae bacterium]
MKWGSYFAPDVAEQKQVVELVAAARTAKQITGRMAMEKLAPVFGVENIEAALTELEEENDAAAQRELDAATAALDAEARARRAGQDPPAGPTAPSGGGGRPPSGQKPPGPGPRKPAPNPPR